MTKKDYELIARAFRDARPISNASTPTVIAAKDALENAARFLADGLAQDNPRFDRARFIAACVKGTNG